MGRAAAACWVGLVVSVAGCQKAAAPAHDWSRTSLFERYEFEVEEPVGALDLKAHRADDKAGHLDELIDYRVGPHRLRVVNGELSLNDTKRGQLQQGDMVKLAADGRLTVNGAERSAP